MKRVLIITPTSVREWYVSRRTLVILCIGSSLILSMILVSGSLLRYRILEEQFMIDSRILYQKTDALFSNYALKENQYRTIKNSYVYRNNLWSIVGLINPLLDESEVMIWVNQIYDHQSAVDFLLNRTTREIIRVNPSLNSLPRGAALLLAVGAIESNYNFKSKSHKGAIGAFQITQTTARELGLKNSWDPHENTLAGISYLMILLDRFYRYPDQLQLTLAAYNAGPTRVAREWIPDYGASWKEISEGLKGSGRSFKETRKFSFMATRLIQIFVSGDWKNRKAFFWFDFRNFILAEDNGSLLALLP